MKKTVAIFPGSFDPITIGHVKVIEDSLKIFHTIIIAIGENNNKTNMFSLAERKTFIETIFKNKERIKIKIYNGLTSDFCRQQNCFNIIRGVRNSNDFDYEHSIAIANNCLNKKINTILIPSSKETKHISSSLVKEIIKNRGELMYFLPKSIISKIHN